MALEKALVEVPVVGGLFQEHSKWLPKPFEVLHNFWFDKTGAVEKRPGIRQMTGLTLPDTGSDSYTSYGHQGVVSSPSGELLAIAGKAYASLANPAYVGTYLWSYAKAPNRWVAKTTTGSTTTTRRDGMRLQQSPVSHPVHVVQVQQYVATLVRVSTKAYLRIVDTSTGAVIVDNADATGGTLGAGFAGKVVMMNCGDNLFTFLFFNSGLTTLRRVTLDPTTLATDLQTVTTYPGAVHQWDATPTTAGRFAVAACVRASGGSVEVAHYVNSTVALLASHTEPTVGDTVSLSFNGASRLSLLWDTAADINCKELNVPNLTVATATFTMMALSTFLAGAVDKLVTGYDLSGNIHNFAFGKLDPEGYLGTWWRVYHPSTASQSLMWIVPWNCPHTKPFTIYQETYVGFTRAWEGGAFKQAESYGVAFINVRRLNINLSDTRPASLEAYSSPLDGFGYDRATASEHTVTVANGPTGTAVIPLPVVLKLSVRKDGTLDPTSNRFGVDVLTLDSRHFYFRDDLFRTTYASKLLHFSGALPSQYDGSNNVEIGYLEPPQLVDPAGAYPVLTPGVTGPEGDTINPGSYSYVAIWEWLDARGNIHRSRPSAPVAVTVAVTSPNTAATVQLGWTTSPLMRRGNQDDGVFNVPRLVVYRTLKNGSVYYRLADNSYVNAPQQWEVVTLDSENDAQVLAAGRELLYTSGGILENDVPPPAKHLQASGGRVWLTSSEQPEVWPSKFLISGEPPSFSASLVIRVDDAQTPLVGTSWLDGLLVIFSQSRIYTIPAASGPGDNGLGQWAPPEEVQSSAGCVSPASIVSYQDGVLFRDKEGIQLLTRGRTVENIGAAVRDITDRYPTTLDAVLDEKNNKVFFLLTGFDDPTPDGTVVLVWDYARKAWSVLTTYMEEDDEGWYQVPWLYSRMCLWEDRLAFSYSTKVLLMGGGSSLPGYDNFTAFLGNQWVRGVVETPWLHLGSPPVGSRLPGALGGYQRLWRVSFEMEKLSDHGLTVKVWADGEEAAPAQTENWTDAQVSALQGLPRERILLGVAHQKCQSVKLRIEDTAPTVPSASEITGFRYHGLTLEIGRKAGTEKAEKANTRLAMGWFDDAKKNLKRGLKAVATGGLSELTGDGILSSEDAGTFVPEAAQEQYFGGSKEEQDALRKQYANLAANALSQADKDAAAAAGARGMQAYALDRYRQMSEGQGPSVGREMLRQGANTAQLQATQLAASARGGGGNQIAAQRLAQQTGASVAQDASMKSALVGQQEQIEGIRGVGEMSSKMREGDFAARALSERRASEGFANRNAVDAAKLNESMERSHQAADAINRSRGMAVESRREKTKQDWQTVQQTANSAFGFFGGRGLHGENKLPDVRA